MKNEPVTLIPATAELSAEFQEMAKETLAARDSRYFTEIGNLDEYFAKLEQYRIGDVPAPFVPSSEFWLVRGRRILGRVSVRHRLNENLEIEGGHIGYDVRPTERRNGYGTLMLKLALDEARKLGLERVMVTCNVVNIASAKIIEKNAGVFDSFGISPATGLKLKRYWIDLGRS